MSATLRVTPAPASKQARATKLDRVKFLEDWSVSNPLGTIEAAREAIKEKFGISLGTKIISDTLRSAKNNWESQRRAMASGGSPGPLSPPPPSMRDSHARHSGQTLPELVSQWAEEMRVNGVRLLELLPDGNIRMELLKPGQQA